MYVRHLWAALARRPDLHLTGLWNPSRLGKGRYRHLPPEIACAAHPRWPLISRWSARRSGALVHGPDFRVPAWRDVPRVVTIHDLASFHADYMPADFAAMSQRRLEQLGRAG
ncbi:hypothetical protein DRQ50_08730, partial [bacterium]